MFCHCPLNLHGFAIRALSPSSGEGLAQEDGSGASEGRSVSILLPRLLVRTHGGLLSGRGQHMEGTLGHSCLFHR